MTFFPQDALGRLAERVVAGEVVFFVGAGFSIDGERNTTERLIGRLLTRFDAMTELLAGDFLAPGLTKEETADRAKELRQGLRITFSLTDTGGRLTSPTHVTSLAREYYNINDWLASAFSVLLGLIDCAVNRVDWERFLRHLSDREQHLFMTQLGEESALLVGITELDLEFLLDLPNAEGGKALFLETMGFSNSEVMAGLPCDSDLTRVEQSYRQGRQRLRPRHHVLACLAREGLAPTLLTTNFDLLLDGAYRLAGLTPQFAGGDHLPPLKSLKSIEGAPPATFDAFRRVTSATEFFGHGDGERSANLLKIHGCAQSYRWARKRKEWFSAYLPSLVFTFREIQNWRDDSWSRDLVSTLLRTRTVVFCGYSGADPVLHDTIRTVYEEMARRRGKLGRDSAQSEEAPAFYLGSADKTEFHGMEILRAASRAIGGTPDLPKHRNYLRFYFEAKEGPSPFPLLDEVMRWLFHLVFRRRQARALESNLGRVATVLFGHPCPEVERRAVLDEFEAMWRAEEAEAAGWKSESSTVHRDRFERTVGWVERFHVPLLREHALGEAVLRSSGPGLELDRLRRSHWYCPALDHADWTAWGAVVELALRRRIAAWQNVEDWKKDRPWIAPAKGNLPSILYSQSETRPTPNCLTILLRSPSSRFQIAEIRGACRRHHTWELDYGGIPWRRQAKNGTPGAATLWKWAHRPLVQIAGGEFDKFF